MWCLQDDHTSRTEPDRWPSIQPKHHASKELSETLRCPKCRPPRACLLQPIDLIRMQAGPSGPARVGRVLRPRNKETDVKNMMMLMLVLMLAGPAAAPSGDGTQSTRTGSDDPRPPDHGNDASNETARRRGGAPAP